MDRENWKQLLEHIIIIKKRLQLQDLNILSLVKSPLHRKWVQEIIVDQYKHEKMLREIYSHYADKEFTSIDVNDKLDPKNLLLQIEQRMEVIFENLILLNKMCEYTENMIAKQMFREIIIDEDIHGHKLSLLYSKY